MDIVLLLLLHRCHSDLGSLQTPSLVQPSTHCELLKRRKDRSFKNLFVGGGIHTCSSLLALHTDIYNNYMYAHSLAVCANSRAIYGQQVMHS